MDKTLESYILKRIDMIRAELMHTENDTPQFYRLSGQLDVLYMCLTAHDNKYEKKDTDGKRKD